MKQATTSRPLFDQEIRVRVPGWLHEKVKAKANQELKRVSDIVRESLIQSLRDSGQ